MLLSLQIELNKVRKASRPFPIGLSLMIFDCGSVMADVTFSRWEGWEEPKKFGELLVGGMERTKKSPGIAAHLTSLLLEELYCRD